MPTSDQLREVPAWWFGASDLCGVVDQGGWRGRWSLSLIGAKLSPARSCNSPAPYRYSLWLEVGSENRGRAHGAAVVEGQPPGRAAGLGPCISPTDTGSEHLAAFGTGLAGRSAAPLL